MAISMAVSMMMENSICKRFQLVSIARTNPSFVAKSYPLIQLNLCARRLPFAKSLPREKAQFWLLTTMLRLIAGLRDAHARPDRRLTFAAFAFVLCGSTNGEHA
jgi:hypothetical protein